MTHGGSSQVAALGWLPTPGRDARAQLALPTDLFLLTVQCSDDGQRADTWGPTLALDVTLLRTRPERFRSRAVGELAFALLTPAGLLAVLRGPLEGATDGRLPLAQFCRPDEWRTLRDGLLREPDPDSRTRLFGTWLEARATQRHQLGMQPQRVAEAAAWIQADPGALDLATLRTGLRVSQRQLERDFRLWLGVSPAAYARIVRFQRAAMALAGGAALGDTAAGEGFADQPHLNRAFRQLSSLTPREFACRTRLRGHPERAALAGRVVVVDAV